MLPPRTAFWLLPLLALPAFAAPQLTGAAPTVVDFRRDVGPIFQERCIGCHGAKKQRGGLRLDKKIDALRGGDSGPVIQPGQAAQSSLVRRVLSIDEAERMPPTGERLTAAQVQALRAWIDQGAPWPQDADTAAASEHWAWRPVRRSPFPVVGDGARARNPIDLFLLARLEKEGLALAPPADRRTLARRLYFDLIGLPPTPGELDAFAADDRPDAYERLVEHLLASPHYGERWARHWLDVVRFAESHGFEMNQPRPNAWPYRDWVIDAFNTDLPYDRFVQAQLAGDALGENAATGFLVAGPWDQVKSPDPVLSAQQRADELHDMVGTTGSAFLGLTLGCARCHNHKFDPVTQNDYYAVTAVLAGTQHGERPLGPATAQEELARLIRQRDLVDAEVAKFAPLAQPGGPAARPPVSHLANEDRVAPVTTRFVRFSITATSGAEACLDELEVYSAGPSPRNVALASLGTKASTSGTLPGFAIHRLEHVNDGQYGNDHSWIASGRAGWVQLEFPHEERIDRIVWSRDRSGSPGAYRDRLALGYHVDVSLDGRTWRTVADSSDRLPAGRTPEAVPPGLSSEQATRLRQLHERRAQINRQVATRSTVPTVYAGKFVRPGPTHRLHRGDPLQPREVVRPEAVASLGPRLELPADAAEQDRRLALARWLTRPDNPLTARVIVNRLWLYHFGEGIVATPSDFGQNGARPSHPGLLDWLASELVDRRWSLKALQRLIVTSAAYRQSSRATPEGLGKDAAGRLLWRYPPHRLEAETLRDAILATSGNLDQRMDGPGFDLFEPNTNYVKVYVPKDRFGPQEWRRMIYQAKPRMQLDGVFGAFDCPDAGQLTAKRNRSTTPLQALNLLNSAFVLQQSNLFAQRLRHEAGPSVPAQVSLAFRLALGRAPDSEERRAAVRLIEQADLEALCRALFNANEFVTVH